jgi:hypothetical protein
LIVSYKLQPVADKEKSLFYRMEGEPAERHGQIGHMRLDFGKNGKEFWTTWFDNQRHLKHYAFKERFNRVVDNLRSEIFKDRTAMRLFCEMERGVSLGERGAGFKLHSGGYTCYLRCKPGQKDYDAYLFAYDDRYLLPELEGKHDTPQGCYGILPSTGEIVLIRRGERNCAPIAYQNESRELNRMFVDGKNSEFGVTRAQEAAMLAGSLFGWDAPAAKPWKYDPDGNLRQPLPRKKDEPER